MINFGDLYYHMLYNIHMIWCCFLICYIYTTTCINTCYNGLSGLNKTCGKYERMLQHLTVKLLTQTIVDT